MQHLDYYFEFPQLDWCFCEHYVGDRLNGFSGSLILWNAENVGTDWFEKNRYRLEEFFVCDCQYENPIGAFSILDVFIPYESGMDKTRASLIRIANEKAIDLLDLKHCGATLSFSESEPGEFAIEHKVLRTSVAKSETLLFIANVLRDYEEEIESLEKLDQDDFVNMLDEQTDGIATIRMSTEQFHTLISNLG